MDEHMQHAQGCAATTVLEGLLCRNNYRSAGITFSHADGVTSLLYRGTSILSYSGSFTREQVVQDLRLLAKAHRERILALVITALREMGLPAGYMITFDADYDAINHRLNCASVTLVSTKNSLSCRPDLSIMTGHYRVFFDTPQIRYAFHTGPQFSSGQVDLLGNGGLLAGNKLESYEAAISEAKASTNRAFEQLKLEQGLLARA